MPKFRYAVLENDVAKGSDVTSGVETIDLPETGILSELHTQVRHKGVYVDNTLLPNYLAVKKLELLVEGSQVIKSLTARQARALMSYNDGPFADTCNYGSAANHNICYDDFILYCNRNAADKRSGLDLSQYANPQLKITWDVSQTAVDGVTYDANTTDPTFTYNVMAKVMDDRPANFIDKYVQSREVNSYNPAASGETNTEIPRGYDLKGIMFGSRYVSLAWFASIDHCKLDFDNGKWLPIDMDYENLAAAMKSWYPGGANYNAWIGMASGDNFDSQMMQVSSCQVNGAGSPCFLGLWGVFEFPLYVMSVYGHDGAAAANTCDMFVDVKGWGPMQTIYIPMKELLDGDADAIDTKPFGRIDFKVTTASYSASAVSHVVAEYLKPNGE